VFVAADGSVRAAGGFLVNPMPDAPEEAVEMLESNIRSLPSPSQMVRESLSADGILDRLLRGLGTRERHRQEPVFHCSCDRDRILRAVIAMGREEMQDIVERNEDLDVRCEFCCERYVISPDQVGTLLQDA
jgi:molecular chaperone Hsp33